MTTKSFTQRKRIRKSFGRIEEVAPMPNLIEVQKASYDGFLQINVPPADRTSFDKDEAGEIQKKLEDAGATVEVK